MNRRDSSAEYAEFLDRLVTSPQADELFGPDQTAALKTALISDAQFASLSKSLESLTQSVGEAANYASWLRHPERWQKVLLLLIEVAADHERRRDAAAKDEDEEKEDEEEEEEPEEDEEDGEDEGSATTRKKLTESLKAINMGYSYIPEITEIVVSLQQKTVISKVTKLSVKVHYKTVSFLGVIKIWIRRIFEFLGLQGVLVIAARLMKKSRFLEAIIKTIGTIIVFVAFLGALVIYPLLRFIQNPWRAIKWLFEDVEIDMPDE